MRMLGAGGRKRADRALLAAVVANVGASAGFAEAQISITEVSGTDWKIGNGDLNVVFDPASNNITSLAIDSSGNLLDPNNSQLYPEFAGTPFGAGTQTSGYQETSSYIDFWTTTASTGTTVNPITYSFHYVLFANDPDVVCYEVLNHSATDPATSVGQGQFIARFNTSKFNQSYQYNVGLNNMGAQTSTIPPTYPADGTPNSSTVDAVPGRNVTNATYDLTGSGLPGDWGSNFNTKYDYASYYQFLQADTTYGSQYAESNIYTSLDSVNGGPTHQDLMSTNLALIGFLSGHVGDANESYVPTQGVNTTRLFGPFAFRFVPTDGETGAQLYTDAVNSMPTLTSDYQTDSELISNGYVPYAQRGSVQISAGNSAGWSGNVDNNTIVLSDPNKMFQESNTGSQYWAQLSSNGTATINNVTPGDYRLTLYELGQWGETRLDGVQVYNGQVTIPQNLKFTPENFGQSIWTIGTPDRSSHEFLNGSNDTYTYAANGNVTTTPITGDGVTPGGDYRQYYGNYNYWYEEQELGTPGYVSYNATAIGSTPATNNANDWIANQWGEFNPGIYDPNDGTTDGYVNGFGPNGGQPAYVAAAGGAGSYKGSPWLVNFTVTQAQMNVASFKYVDLSVGLAANEGSLIVELNGHQEIWHYGNSTSDPMVRSSDSGTYQFLVFEFPIADLNAAGAADQFQFSVSQNDGVMYDALRMELSVSGANPSITGWNDYDYITGANTQTDANNALGLSTLTWTNSGGTGNGMTWDTGVNQNWSTGVAETTYSSSVATVFNDSNNGHYNVTLNTTVTPSSVLVNNSSGNYLISGTGKIAGSTGLAKYGSDSLTLNTVNSYTGGTVVNAGTLVVGVAGAVPANSSVTVNGGIVQLASGIGTSTLSSLTLNNTSTLDIGDNRLIIDYGSGPDPITSIETWIKNGFYGMPGPSIISSDVATADAATGLSYGIGYADGADGVVAGLPSGEIEIMFTLLGDANLDGTVNAEDFTLFSQHVGQSGGWDEGDFNDDGTVNAEDFTLFSANLGQSIVLDGSADFTVESAQSLNSVPEPATAGVLGGITGLALARRRRRQVRLMR